MNYEEENHRRRQYEQRQQGGRRRDRDERDINDFRSRWNEPSSEYLHSRKRQWAEEDDQRGSVRGDHREINYAPAQRRGRGESYQQNFPMNPEQEYREHQRGHGAYNSNNQHANDRWHEDNYRRQNRHRYLEERPRRSSDEEDWDNHRHR